MALLLPKLLGAVGLVLITYAIFAKSERRQDVLFILGGLGLLVYSISLRDPIFVPLQIVFIAASAYELATMKKKKPS